MTAFEDSVMRDLYRIATNTARIASALETLAICVRRVSRNDDDTMTPAVMTFNFSEDNIQVRHTE